MGISASDNDAVAACCAAPAGAQTHHLCILGVDRHIKQGVFSQASSCRHLVRSGAGVIGGLGSATTLFREHPCNIRCAASSPFPGTPLREVRAGDVPAQKHQLLKLHPFTSQQQHTTFSSKPFVTIKRANQEADVLQQVASRSGPWQHLHGAEPCLAAELQNSHTNIQPGVTIWLCPDSRHAAGKSLTGLDTAAAL